MIIRKEQLQHDWFILTSLVSKDFKLKYRRSMLGVLWSVLNPLLMMIVLSAVFSQFSRLSIECFPVYLILGQTIYQLVSDATQGAMTSIIDSAPLIKKIRINKFLFPLEKVSFALVNFAVSLIAVAAVMCFFQIMPTATVVLLPLLVVYVYLFALGLGMLLSALSVFFRDMLHLWSVILTAWMYATPIIYSIDILPDWMVRLEQFNPMYYFVEYFRDIMMYGTCPSIPMNIACACWALASLALGYAVFKRQQKKFILYV